MRRRDFKNVKDKLHVKSQDNVFTFEAKKLTLGAFQWNI
jgi:hypothetical protein